MQNLVHWVKTHKLLTVLLLIVGYFFSRNFFGYRPLALISPRVSVTTDSYYAKNVDQGSTFEAAAPVAEMAMPSRAILPPVAGNSTNLAADERKVVTNTNFSLLVDDVSSGIAQLKSQAEQLGGFMVSSSVNRPEEGGSGTLVVRVPSDQLDTFLNQVRGAAVRVVSENVYGHDVTDQYADIESRLETLNATKQTYQAMMAKANDIDEILRVQQAIFNVQDQIDRYTGQLQYLEDTTSSSLVTIYLSTDELSLPYSPAEPWRPQVVFKTAVRSMMQTLRGGANLAIWGVVYSPVLIVGVIVYLVGRRIMRKNSS